MPSKPNFDLAVVIVNWNAGKYLLQCLATVPESSGSLNPEVFVVDNASTDGSPDLVAQQYPSVRLIRNKKNLGFARGNNIALALSKAPWVAFVNPDLQLAPGSLVHLVNFMEQEPLLGAIGPGIVTPDGHVQGGAYRFPRLTDHVPILGRLFSRNSPPGHASDPVLCDFVHGSCLVARRQALEDIGGMPDVTFLYGEEILLGHALRQHGWQVAFDPRVAVLHHDDVSANQRWDRPDKLLAKRAALTQVMATIHSRLGFAIWNTLSLIGTCIAAASQQAGWLESPMPYSLVARLHFRSYRHITRGTRTGH